MSQGKQRPLERGSAEERLLEGVRALCRGYPVDSVSGHMAAQSAEFGITIHLASNARDFEIASLRTALSLFMDAFYQALSPRFTWMVMFRRGDKPLDPLLPGNRPHDA